MPTAFSTSRDREAPIKNRVIVSVLRAKELIPSPLMAPVSVVPSVLGAVFNSRVYQVASYLHEKGWKLAGLVGYDLLHKNTEFLKTGEVTFLIGQRPGLQGYCGVKTLCNHVVFKRPVTAVKYMPIDILMKENIDFYFEFE